MLNIAVTENASEIKKAGTTAEAAAIKAISVIGLDINYAFKKYLQKSFYTRVTIPLLSPNGTGYFLGSLGVNFYFNSLSSVFSFQDRGTTLIMVPTFRYYAGFSVGLGFLIYQTQTAKKSDTFLDLGGHGGISYNLSKTWGLGAELSVGKITGVSTSGLATRMFVGSTYFFK